MAYRTSFTIMTVAQFVVCGLDFVAIVIMFGSIDALGGFSLAEVAFLYGGAGLCLGMADLLLGNIERLGTKVRMGTFDTMLIRPVPLFAQMCADEFALRRIGRIAQAAVVLAWSVTTLDLDWTPAKVLMLGYLVVCGTAIFVAFFTLGAALPVLDLRRVRGANAFTYGGNTFAQFPLTIFRPSWCKAVTFVIPLAFVNWYPSLFILGRGDPFGLPEAFQFAAPVAAVALGLLASAAWSTGVRRYRSTGS